jgi:hypothetical protein
VLRGTLAGVEDMKARSQVSQGTSARSNGGHSRDIKQFTETSDSLRVEVVERTVPAELTNKMARVRAVQKQLSLSVLFGKKFEKLKVQGGTLDRARSTSVTLKPKMKKRQKRVWN